MADLYLCTICAQCFTKSATDEAAVKESQSVFGPLLKEQLAIVCDECWRTALGFAGIAIPQQSFVF